MNINNDNLPDASEKIVWKSEDLKKIKSIEFSTHYKSEGKSYDWGEKFYYLGSKILLPWKKSLQLFARVIQPAPGKNKNSHFRSLAIRVGSAVGCLCLMPVGLLSLGPGAIFHSIGHVQRKPLSYIDNSANVKPKGTDLDLNEKEELSGDNQESISKKPLLHLRTHNLGFVYEFFRIIGDLRSPVKRAEEVAESILTDENQPDVICFQEAFHLDATSVLCERLKEKYPYIIHNISPHVLGLNSGAVIASKYPIEEVSFRRFTNMLGPEKLSPRGLVGVKLKVNGEMVTVYSTHLQALLGKERSEVREQQLKDIDKWMKADKEESGHQILVGDFNASHVTAWGEKNESDEKFFDYAEANFTNVFELDHDKMTGERTNDERAQFLKADNKRLGQEDLPEPRGTWYTGPFYKKGKMMEFNEWLQRVLYKEKKREKIEGVVRLPNTWGTKKWTAKQEANTARFDHIFLPKGSKLQGKAEIRRGIIPSYKQSASTDHLPVDVILEVRENNMED